MSTLKFSALWLLFAVTYVVFFIPVFLYFPEIWLHDLLTGHGQRFIDEGEWDKIFMLSVMWSTVAVNLVFIFLSLAIAQRLRKSANSGFQHNDSIRLKAFKLSTLWLVFAATYFGFVGLISSVLPTERWLSYLFREDYDQLVIEGKWKDILVPTLLLSALMVNLVFIFLSLTITKRLRNRKNCTDERA